ncbi:MAG: hypothetical protein ABIT83_18370, partial [Massilia sp.]
VRTTCAPPVGLVSVTWAMANPRRVRCAGLYASVQKQSGIRAGDGAFQLKVGGNTDLKGAVISSSAAGAASSNTSTATLTPAKQEFSLHGHALGDPPSRGQMTKLFRCADLGHDERPSFRSTFATIFRQALPDIACGTHVQLPYSNLMHSV